MSSLPWLKRQFAKVFFTTPPESYNLFVILTHEYKDIWRDMGKSKNWYHKFMYVFAAPGWSHDGSTLTIKQMIKEQKAESLKMIELETK